MGLNLFPYCLFNFDLEGHSSGSRIIVGVSFGFDFHFHFICILPKSLLYSDFASLFCKCLFDCITFS